MGFPLSPRKATLFAGGSLQQPGWRSLKLQTAGVATPRLDVWPARRSLIGTWSRELGTWTLKPRVGSLRAVAGYSVPDLWNGGFVGKSGIRLLDPYFFIENWISPGPTQLFDFLAENSRKRLQRLSPLSFLKDLHFATIWNMLLWVETNGIPFW